MRTNERFKDAYWADQTQTIVIGGAGGIGSYLTLLLARTGRHYIQLYDMDRVEDVNIGGQLFKTSDIGQHKANAVRNTVNSFCANTHISVYNRYDSRSSVSPIMFSAFDNMSSRKLMFDKWESGWKPLLTAAGISMEALEDKYQYLYVDGRMSAEFIQIFFVTPSRAARYREHLFDDASVPDEVCSFKATSHFGAMIAARMVQGFTAFLANKKLRDDVYELPFLVTENGPLFQTLVEF